jgi:hypothetical protein
MIARAYSVHRKQSWLLPTRLLHITRTDENQIPAVLILITSLNLVSRCVSGVQHPARANSVGARLALDKAPQKLQARTPVFWMARLVTILIAPPTERREAEWRCRGVGRSAWMPSERRWAMDGPSARARTTVPERGNPCEAGAGRQRKMVSPLCRNKGGRPSGRNRS